MDNKRKMFRQRTDAMKSFPDAVAALVLDALRRGATRVTVQVGNNRALCITDDGAAMGLQELKELARVVCDTRPAHPALAFVHHAESLHMKSVDSDLQLAFTRRPDGGDMMTTDTGKIGFHSIGSTVTHLVEWKNLGTGDGVNAQQDRTAARLVKRLPALLTPSQAAKVTVMDEEGRHHDLKVDETTKETVGGYEFVCPVTLTDISRMEQGGELRIAYDGQTKPMREFVAVLPPHFRLALRPLASPWLRGVVEVTEPAGRRDELREQELGKALGDSRICDRATEQIQAVMRDIAFGALGRSGEFLFNGRRWQGSVEPQMLRTRDAAWIDPEFDSPDLVTPIVVDPLHALYQRDSDPIAVQERTLFAIAECLRERFGLTMSITAVFLDLCAAIDKTRAS